MGGARPELMKRRRGCWVREEAPTRGISEGGREIFTVWLWRWQSEQGREGLGFSQSQGHSKPEVQELLSGPLPGPLCGDRVPTEGSPKGQWEARGQRQARWGHGCLQLGERLKGERETEAGGLLEG